MNQMPITYHIVLCGQSIFLHTIEAALAEDPSVEVLRLHPSMPLIIDETLYVGQDKPLPMESPGVLWNDIDPQGDGLSVTLLNGPLSGTLG